MTRSLFDAVVRPSEFVSTQTSAYSLSIVNQGRQFLNLLFVYLINLAIYALPLTLAGFGLQPGRTPPPTVNAIVGGFGVDPAITWNYTVGFIQNSAFITAAAALTFVTYHGGVYLTRSSRGLLQSLHTVVYSTSAYLAGLFTVVWYISTTPGLDRTRAFVLNLQRAFIYAIIDALGADVGLPGGRPDQVVLTGVSQAGQLILALTMVLVGYYLYSLYLGARINHLMGRLSALTAVTAVTVSPVFYVAGSLIVSTTTGAFL